MRARGKESERRAGRQTAHILLFQNYCRFRRNKNEKDRDQLARSVFFLSCGIRGRRAVADNYPIMAQNNMHAFFQ
jgi:hypothetical protein